MPTDSHTITPNTATTPLPMESKSETSPSMQDRAKAELQRAEGMTEKAAKSVQAAWEDTKATVKETLGYDGADNRVEADKLRAEGKAKEAKAKMKADLMESKAKVNEPMGH